MNYSIIFTEISFSPETSNLLGISRVIIDINYAKFCEYSSSNINDIKY